MPAPRIRYGHPAPRHPLKADPESLWGQLLRAVNHWLDDDDDEHSSEEEASEDPSLMFHLMLTAPLIIGILAIVRRTTSP